MSERDLTVNQRRFLAIRPLFASDAEAAKATGVRKATTAEWKRESPEFLRLYDDLYSGSQTRTARAIIQKGLEAAAEKAVPKLFQLMDDKDPKIRVKAIELSFRAMGLLKEVRETTEVQMPWEVKVAVERLMSGESIPPQMEDLLRSFLGSQNRPPLPPAQSVIEGEVL